MSTSLMGNLSLVAGSMVEFPQTRNIFDEMKALTARIAQWALCSFMFSRVL